jgi:hypothetical protein
LLSTVCHHPIALFTLSFPMLRENLMCTKTKSPEARVGLEERADDWRKNAVYDPDGRAAWDMVFDGWGNVLGG